MARFYACAAGVQTRGLFQLQLRSQTGTLAGSDRLIST